MKKYSLFTVLFLMALSLIAAPPQLTVKTRGVASGFRTVDGVWSKYISTAGILRGRDGFTIIFGASLKYSPDIKTVTPEQESEAIFGGEVMEVLLAPEPASGVYYHFAVNHDGAVYTAKKRDMSWEPEGFICRVKHIRDYWEAKMFIPYKAIGMKYPANGTSIKALFARSRKTGKGVNENTNWSGCSDYHDLSQFGTINFVGTGTNVELIALVSQAQNGHFIIDKGDINTEKVKVEIVDGDGRVANVNIVKEHPMLLQGQFTVSGSSQREVPLKNRMMRTLRVRDNSGKIIFERTGFVENIAGQLFELDRFRLTDNEKSITARVSASGKYQWQIIDGSGKCALQGEGAGPKLTVPVSSLKNGRYSLKLITQHGFAEQVFIKMPLAADFNPIPQGGKWSIDGEVFKKNGVPVYLFGGSGTPKRFPRREKIFTLGAGCQGRLPGSIGVTGIAGVKRLIRKPATGYLYKQDVELDEAFEKHLKQNKKASPQICRMVYEANLRAFVADDKKQIKEISSVEMVKKTYKRLRRKDYPHFLSLQIDRQERTAEFAPYCDVFEITCLGGYAKQPLPQIAFSMADVRSKVRNKPVIHWLGVTIPNNSCRVVEELRAELFLSVLNGGAGAILHLGHGYLPAERKRLWCYISTAADEINQIFRIVQGGKKLPLSVPDNFRAGLYEYQGKRYLIAVNLSEYIKQWDVPGAGKVYFAGWESRLVELP